MPVLYSIGGLCQGALVYFIFIFIYPELGDRRSPTPSTERPPLKAARSQGPFIFSFFGPIPFGRSLLHQDNSPRFHRPD
jgi:hypothetical protein